MSPNINKEVALKIVGKLDAQLMNKGKNAAHDQYGVYHEGQLIAITGIRRSSSKDSGHDHIPRDLNINAHLAKEIGTCTKYREHYLEKLRERNLLMVPPSVSGMAAIGVFADGDPHIRHDGIMLTSVREGGPAENAGIKSGDIIMAINGRQIFTIAEFQEEISRYQPGTKISIRSRRYSTIQNAEVVVGTV